MIEVEHTIFDGVLLLKPKAFKDERGSFQELYRQNTYSKLLFNSPVFVQENFSKSSVNVLRGLHYQKTKKQGKLISVLSGKVFDVVVDINIKSKTFGQHLTFDLSSDNNYQLYIPPGYAHGFCVLSEKVDFFYKCTDYYDPADEGGIIWNCPKLAINWPINNPIVSIKDQKYSGLSETVNI